MLFTHVRTTNFQSHDATDLELDAGLVLIHGDNGSGKSALLRALFTGLFQSRARGSIGQGFTLDEFVRDGEDHAEIEVGFLANGHEYTVTWELEITGSGDDENARTVSCALEGPDETTTGPRAVADRVAQLVGMDADAFAHSVYAQQSELDQLVKAEPETRQEILDNLLGLSGADAYIERANEARLAAQAMRKKFTSRADQVRAGLEDLDEAELKADRQTHAKAVADAEDQLEKVDEQLEGVQNKRQEVKEQLSAHEDLLERDETLESEITELEEKIERFESEISELEEKIEAAENSIETHEEAIEVLDETVDGHDLSAARTAREARDQLQDDYEELTGALSGARATAESKQQEVNRLEKELSTARDDLSDLKTELENQKATVADVEETLSSAEAELEAAETRRDEAVALVLEVDAEEVTQDYEAAVETLCTDLEDIRQDRELRKREAGTAQDRAREAISTTEADLKEARAELETIQSRLDTSVVDPIEAFEDAISHANHRGDAFEIEVSADSLDYVLTTELPATMDEELDAYAEAADDAGDAHGMVRYHEAREETLQGAADACPICSQEVPDAGTSAEDEVPDVGSDLATARQAHAVAEKQRAAARARLDELSDLSRTIHEAASFRALAGTKADIEALEEELETLQRDLEGAERTERQLADGIEEMEEELAAAENALETLQIVDDHEQAVDEAARELENERTELAELEAELEDQEEAMVDAEEALDDAKEELATTIATRDDLAEQQSPLEQDRDAARKAVEHHDKIATLKSKIDTTRASIDGKRDQLADLESTLKRTRDNHAEVEEELGEISRAELESKEEKLESLIAKLKKRRKAIQDELGDARADLRSVTDKIEMLREKREDLARLEEQSEWAREIETDMDRVSTVYDGARTELRSKLVQLLTEYTNEAFRDLYHSEAYTGLQIGEDYSIALVNADNTTRDPGKASGGEGVIANLALRAGVYRVLTDLFSSTASLPPFILDEPTQQLDDEHISKIAGMITNIREWDVPQVIVVSHRDGLIHDADHEIYVEKDPVTDTSVVTHDGVTNMDEAATDGGSE